MKEIKKQLYKLCIQLIEQKLFQVKDAIRLAQESANSDTKSSMGDKYETGRAMAQLEIEKSTIQKSELEGQLQTLTRMALVHTSEIIVNGSLIMTNAGNYYISVSAGAIQVEDKKYFAISSQSPIAQKMLGLKTGEIVELNGKRIEILKVY